MKKYDINKLSVNVDAHTKLKVNELCEALNITTSNLLRIILRNIFDIYENEIDMLLDELKNNNIENEKIEQTDKESLFINKFKK